MSIYNECERSHGDIEGFFDFIARTGAELSLLQGTVLVIPEKLSRLPMAEVDYVSIDA